MGKRRTGVWAAWVVVGLCGCQGQSGTYETVRLPTDDYGRTFEVAREVLSTEFEVQSADAVTGRIETAAKGLASGTRAGQGPVAMPWSQAPSREQATAWVTRGEGGTVRVSVRVQMLAAANEGGGVPPTYDEERPSTTSEDVRVNREINESGKGRYRVVGTDGEKERKLLAEIERRLKGPTGGQ